MESNWGLTIKRMRNDLNITQEELHLRSGIDKSHISRIELGAYQSYKTPIIRKLAKGLGVTPEQLIRRIWNLEESYVHKGGLVTLRKRGAVPAGNPFPEEEENLGVAEIPLHLLNGAKPSDCFVLEVSGNSLIGDGINDGDLLVVERTTDIIDGKIYILNLGPNTCARHVFIQNGHLRLVSSNHKFQDINVEDAQIIGRVVACYHANLL